MKAIFFIAYCMEIFLWPHYSGSPEARGPCSLNRLNPRFLRQCSQAIPQTNKWPNAGVYIWQALTKAGTEDMLNTAGRESEKSGPFFLHWILISRPRSTPSAGDKLSCFALQMLGRRQDVVIALGDIYVTPQQVTSTIPTIRHCHSIYDFRSISVWLLVFPFTFRPIRSPGAVYRAAQKRGHHLIANILKFHDRIAWKLVNFCNIICWTQSLNFCLKIHRAVAPPSENTATVVYSHSTNRFEHHTVAVFFR